MQLMIENTVDAAQEKHVPIIEKTEEGIKVKVGSIPHPMEPEHFIKWVEINVGENNCKHFLKPEDKPDTLFNVKPENPKAKAYCNLHGLWQSE